MYCEDEKPEPEWQEEPEWPEIEAGWGGEGGGQGEDTHKESRRSTIMVASKGPPSFATNNSKEELKGFTKSCANEKRYHHGNGSLAGRCKMTVV